MISHYPYRDESGDVQYRVVVDRTSKSKKTVFQQRYVDGEFVNGMIGVILLLFRLPELLAAIARGETVYICEGEKDVMRLVGLGLVATTNTGGAGKWLAEYAKYFDGAHVVIVGDIDEAGSLHVRQVTESLLEHGTLASLRVVDLTTLGRPLPPKGDVSDFLDAGGSIHEVTMAAEAAPELVVADPEGVEQPTIIEEKLPPLSARIVSTEDDDQDRTTLLMSCLVTLGSFMTTVFMCVAGRNLFPMLYFMAIGAAGTGKGLASVSRDLVYEIHRSKRDEYNRQVAAYEIERDAHAAKKSKDKGPPPKPPARLSLIMPGNSTAPVILEAMGINLSLLIHETEADVMASMLKADYGDLSGVLRQGHTHEPVSFGRARLNEIIEVAIPRLALCITGTPGQVGPLFRDGENGLVSRFAFHVLTRRSKYKDQFNKDLWNVQSIGAQLAPRVASLYDALSKLAPLNIEVCFTRRQRDELRPMLEAFDVLAEDDGDTHTAVVRRNPILIARFATILTIARFIDVDGDDHLTSDALAFLESGQLRIEVQDDDFDTALSLAQYALQTARIVGRLLPATTPATLHRAHKGAEGWYSSLPPEVERKVAVEIGKSFGMSQRTVDRKLNEPALFIRTRSGFYSKTACGKVAT
ncbi:MAG: DUF3987 domain-containing protein [Ignavibacteria bacterium]|nr:DUF3987 domain-containing protein [Ignavibacteria bacterium]MBK9182335.1 DUF3987 domain-containing protein [Ignavibacteria bacterium]MBL0323410.1 DUF3987 domain-containing protein [Ignavibacteria bacterium]